MTGNLQERDITSPLILVVDDNAANLGVVAMGLDTCGYKVLVAEHGKKAIERASRLQPDLILLDVMMPDIDGFEVCRRLKKQPTTRSIPIIFMTALDDTKNKLTAFEVGGVDYVTKPLQIEEVIARVKTQLQLYSMHKQLAEQNDELAQHRDNLEQLVAGRTLELESLNKQLIAEIGEREKAQEKLSAREREFRTLAENAPDNIARIDRECRYLYINPMLERTLGIKSGDIIGKSVMEAFPDEDYTEAMQSSLNSVISTGMPAEIELVLPDVGKRVRYHSLRLVAERDQAGEISGVLAIGRDITDFKDSARQLEAMNLELKTMAQRRETAREEERKHIARELHDELGQYLTALSLHASALSIEFSDQGSSFQSKLDQMLSLIDRTKKVTRNLSQKLRPVELDMGVGSALETLVDQFAMQYGIECRLEHREAADDLDDSQAIILYRVVQESLTNIARHAQATTVSIDINARNNGVILEVLDDGTGFDPTRIKATSFGLVGMRERVQAVGGQLDISSGPGHGTRITVYLPTDEHNEEQT